MRETSSLVSAVGLLGQDPVPCQLDALDEGSARVRVPVGVELPETSSLALWLTDPESGTSVALPAYSGWPEQEGETLVCDVYFAQPNALQPRAEGAPERRMEARLTLPQREVEVWVVSDRAGAEGDGVQECTLVDIGPGGMCVELPAGREPTTPFTSGEFQLLLPGQTWPLVLCAQIRHRQRRSEEVVRYGVVFDSARSTNFAEQRASLARFVQDRVEQFAGRRCVQESAQPAA